MRGSFRISGAGDILSAIDELADDFRKGGEQNVLRAAGRVIESAAKANASHSQRTGQLAKSIGLKVKKVKRGPDRGNYTVRVGARTGFATVIMEGGKPKRTDPVRYAHFVEYGTSKIPAKPFIRPAVESTKEEVVSVMAKALEKHIARAVKRKAKKNGLSS